MPRPWYCTRESVKAALDVKETSRSNSQIDQAIASSSDAIDGGPRIGGLLKRRFYPEVDTRYFDWPVQGARPWRLWLNQHELISASALIAGGTTIAASNYFLRPDDGPPFTHVEIDLSSSAGFSAGSTHQRAISIAGVYGHSADEEAAGALAEALDTTETGVDVTDSSAIGVGNIIKVDSERMIVTGKGMLDTGQNVSTLTASKADVSITSITAGTLIVDETILVDSERMRVVDVAGTTVTVERAYDGSVLAAHTVGADIYAPRTLTVTRGALGTTAATHLTAAAITRHLVPDLVQELCVAKALNTLLQRRSGYARTIGSGDSEREMSGRGLRQVHDDAFAAHGRRLRGRAI